MVCPSRMRMAAFAVAAIITAGCGPNLASLPEDPDPYINYPRDKRNCNPTPKCFTPPDATNEDPPDCTDGCVWNGETSRCEAAVSARR